MSNRFCATIKNYINIPVLLDYETINVKIFSIAHVTYFLNYNSFSREFVRADEFSTRATYAREASHLSQWFHFAVTRKEKI